MKLSIIIPVYNERQTIATLIYEVQKVQLPAGVEKEIIVVDDGSTDGTTDILKDLRPDPRLKVFLEWKNQGKTAAVKLGLEKATGDMFLIQDADLEYPPEHYPALLQPILDRQAQVVYGSRFKGEIKGMAWINRFANTMSVWTINCLYGTNMTDFHTCFKVFTKDALSGIRITSKHFSIDTELTAKFLKKKLKIVEVPIHYVARKRSEGKKITWSTALESYWFLIKYRFSRQEL